jgi:sarcosine oxidase
MKTAIVLGLGAMGSAAAQHLAMSGYRVLGFDRYRPPHVFGSSHGRTRIIRQCYFEDPRYVPLLVRAYELWEKLSVDARVKLLHLIGAINVGPSVGELVARSQESATQFGLEHRMLSAADLRREYPQFRVEDDWAALLEKNAGYVIPEDCVEAQLRMAAAAGAMLHFDEPVLDWSATAGGGVTMRTAKETYSADKLIVAAGAWAPQMLKTLNLPLKATRQVVAWFAQREATGLFRPTRLPVFLCEGAPGERLIYGFPDLDPLQEGVKIGIHGSDEVCTPETIDRTIRPSDQAALRSRVEQTFPMLPGDITHAETCFYTMTPDHHFVIDRHPQFTQVIVAAGYSGHGFKFASVFGEVLAGLAMETRSSVDLNLFSLERFEAPAS